MSQPAANEKIVYLHEIEFMAALLRLEHQHEGRVFIDIDLFHGVHHNPDLQIPHRFLIPA
jgi:7,8-dihydro-6-hydroxymethylpterin-pyrophosphokinase